MLKRILKAIGGALLGLFSLASFVLAIFAVFWMNQTVSENAVIFLMSPILGYLAFLMIKSAVLNCSVLDASIY